MSRAAQPHSTPFFFLPSLSPSLTRFTLEMTTMVATPGLVVTAQGIDNQQVTHQLPVEFVGDVPGFVPVIPENPVLTQIVLKLPEGITTAGDLRVRITAHGRISNEA